MDIGEKSYTMTTGTEKRTKCTSQIFDFSNFITHFLNDRNDIFQNVKMCEIIKKTEISQIVLQKSITFRNGF